MTDDIVMRLRASSLAWRISLMPEAADEIERLRAENARLRARVAEYFSEPDTHPIEDA